MAIITREDIHKLADVHDAHCVSIFIPTHRSGQEVLQEKDVIVLKNQLKDVSTKLEGQGLNPNEVQAFLKPVSDLLDDRLFWRYQSDGLALFLTDDHFQKFTLPVKFEAFNYVSNEFYLKPLMPMFGGDGRFFILALELEDVNFYEGTRHSIAEVYIDDLTPSKLQDRVGYDYREKFLQFRSQQEGQGNALFHGHGDPEANRKGEIKKYFKAINDGLMEMLHDEDPPMVVASLDYFFPIYKEVNDYKNLFVNHISGNPADADILTLHEKAWRQLQPHFDEERKQKLAHFKELQVSEKTSSDIAEVLPAVLDGRVDTLFLQNKAEVWGIYDPTTREVTLHETHHAPNVSLLNLAAIKTFLKGGHVYLLEKDEMPNPESIVNALYRF